MQEQSAKEKVTEVIEQDIWGSMVDFWNLGWSYNVGDTPVSITLSSLVSALVVLNLISKTRATRPSISITSPTNNDLSKMIKIPPITS